MGEIIFNEEQINDILNRYTKNFESLSAISKIYNCDCTIIRKILTEKNIKITKGSAFSVKFWVERGLTDEEAKIKVKQFKPCLMEYWLARGFNEEESKLKTELHLMNTERAYILKFGEEIGKKKFNEIKNKQGSENSKRRIEYWLIRGLSVEEAKDKVKEHQTTFSLEKCIEKYGYDTGVNVFNSRQKKWQDTIKNKKDYDEIQKRKISKSFDKIVEKYPEDYIEIYFKYNLYKKNFDFLFEYVKNKDYNGFLEKIKQNVVYSGNKTTEISKIKLFQKIFNKTNTELKNDINKLYNVRTKQSYGTTFMVNGVIVKSLGEKKIFELLTELGIDFLYDKFYPNQKKFKFDFYLPKYDIYIEYFGMLNVGLREENKKIISEYIRKCDLKKNLCIVNGYNFLFSKNIDDIIIYLQNLKYDTEKNNNQGLS